MSKSHITTDPEQESLIVNLPPIHPGEILKEDFLEPLHLSANALARALDVPPNRITEILNGKRSITADTALRLSRYFGTSAELWMNLQQSHDLKIAARDHGEAIVKAVRPRAA